MELPLTKKGTVTEEDVLKKMEKNQKRRVAALKRKEKRKVRNCLGCNVINIIAEYCSPRFLHVM